MGSLALTISTRQIKTYTMGLESVALAVTLIY
jgi:hypothetical protein